MELNGWERFYYIFKYSIYFLYGVTFFKLWDKSSTYLDLFNYFWQLILGLILIILYNPFIYIKSHIRQDAVFTAGFMLITTSNLLLLKQYGTEIWNWMVSNM